MKRDRVFIYIAVCVGFLIISFLYYGQIWQQVVYKDPPEILTAQGETHVYEFVAESVRENILQGKNPFTSISSVMHPTGWNFAPDDMAPINGFFLLLLRPFMSAHQSFMLIVIASVFITNISMYYFLRLLNINPSISFLIGAVFGFTPFSSYRIWGHPTYVASYLFIFPAIFYVLLLKAKNKHKKVTYAVGLGFSLAIIPVTNLYYAVMISVMIAILIASMFFFQRKRLITIIKLNWKYLLLSIISSIFILFGWFIKVYESLLINGYPEARPVSDSVLLSANIFSIIWPARNPFYQPIVQNISTAINFNPWFETLIYPGIILLLCAVMYISLRNKLPSYLKVIGIAGAVMYAFTLGPYLRIAGIIMHISLPYQWLYKLPFVQMARAPARFIVPVLFIFSIIAAYVLAHLERHLNSRQKIAAFVLLLLILLVDQSVTPAYVETIVLPQKIYEYLQQHKEGPLFEIPFTVRDGIKNFGYANGVWTVRVNSRHGHPVFSVYAGRVPDDMFEYYRENPLLGTIGNLVDMKAYNHNKIISTLDISNSIRTLDFYRIRFTLLQNSKKYTPAAKQLLTKLAFHPILYDSGYSLWERIPKKLNVTNFDFKSDDSSIILGHGWGEAEKNGRWAQRKMVRVFLNSPVCLRELSFNARALSDNQRISVYFNDHHLGDVEVDMNDHTYTLPVEKNLSKEINTVQFVFSDMFVPSRVFTGSADNRELGAFFKSVKLY